MSTVSYLDWGSRVSLQLLHYIDVRQHITFSVSALIPFPCCLQMVAEIVKDAHLSDFAWILRPMDEKAQKLWMSGEFVATQSLFQACHLHE